MTQTSIELRDGATPMYDDAELHGEPNDAQPQAPATAEFSLPPVDTGRGAWLCLAASWGVEAVTFGFGFSFGVFQDYYSSHEPFAGSGSIAAIGTTTTVLMYVGTPFVLMVCRRYPRQARWFTLAGLCMASLALATSSFCTSVPQLIGTQGVLYGLGGCIAYCPCTLYIDEWFVRRKGLAYGLVWSAAGIGGVVLPLVIEALLRSFGFQTAVRICAGILFVSSAPLAFFIRPRLPISANVYNKPFNMRFAVSKLFIFRQLANVVQATGYFLPSIYLPLYARTTFGASSLLSALTIILINITTTIGLIIMGWLSDRLSVTTCMLISSVGGAISVLVIWGLASSFPVLYLFCVLYGLFAGSWAAIWPAIMREMSQRGGEDGRDYADPVMVQGHLCVGRGLGNIVSGPLSDALTKGMPWQGRAIGGFGSGYGGLVLYTGLTGLVGGLNFVLKVLHVL